MRPHAAISSSQYSWCSPPRTSRALIRQPAGNSCRWIFARPRPTARIREPGSQARVRSSLIVVGNPLPHDRPQMLLAQRDHVIQAFPADRSHQPFTIDVGLRRLYGGSYTFQPKCPQLIVNFCRKDRIPIMNQESVDVIARDGFSKLLQGPNCSRMGRNIALQNAATSHFHQHEHIQHAESGRDRHQKTTGHDDLSVIANKRPPVLRGCSPTASRITILRPVRPHRSRRNQDPEL